MNKKLHRRLLIGLLPLTVLAILELLAQAFLEFAWHTHNLTCWLARRLKRWMDGR